MKRSARRWPESARARRASSFRTASQRCWTVTTSSCLTTGRSCSSARRQLLRGLFRRSMTCRWPLERGRHGRRNRISACSAFRSSIGLSAGLWQAAVCDGVFRHARERDGRDPAVPAVRHRSFHRRRRDERPRRLPRTLCAGDAGADGFELHLGLRGLQGGALYRPRPEAGRHSTTCRRFHSRISTRTASAMSMRASCPTPTASRARSPGA